MQEEAANNEDSLKAQLEDEKKAVGALQDDMRLVYRKNKKELQALEEKYQHENYKERYLSGVAEVELAIEESKVGTPKKCPSRATSTFLHLV